MFDRHRTNAGVLAATLTGVALFVPAPAATQDVHGAIAFGTETDRSDGVAYGFAWNFPAKDTAHMEAVNACVSSGGTNCIQLAWFQDACGALAMDQHGNAQGKPGMTQEQAEARALQTCEAVGGAGCTIVGSLCTTPDGEPGTWSGSETVLPAQGAQTVVTGPTDGSPAHEELVPSQDAQAVVTEPEEESLAREERVLVQQTLNALGFDAGPADGIFGPRTRAAIREWQRASGHEATGQVTREQFAALAAVEVAQDQDQEPRQEDAGNRSGEVLVFGPETGPKCAEGYSEGELCWVEFANKPGCFFLYHSYFGRTDIRHTSSWSGTCLGNVAHGRGTIRITAKGSWHGIVLEATGEMAHGNMQGRWSFRIIRGKGLESHYSLRTGAVYECQYVDSKVVGWVSMRWPHGDNIVYVFEIATIGGKLDMSRSRNVETLVNQ